MATFGFYLTAYHGNDPAELAEALASIAAQTQTPDEILLVEDGPLSPELHRVLDDFARDTAVRRIRMPVNGGSAASSQAALDATSCDWLLRQDADDVSLPERLATQADYLSRHPGIDALGSAVQEFGGSHGIRALPERHADLCRYARINSPINNPTAAIRVAAARAVGGYQHVPKMEDYDMWARLIAGGYRLHNLPEALVRFRVTDRQFSRRTTGLLRAEAIMQRRLVSYGLVSRPRAVLNFALRQAYRVLPHALLRRVYGRLFHARGRSRGGTCGPARG